MEMISLEKKRKQRFAFLCIAFVFTASIAFAIVDFFEQDTMELFVDILVMLFLVAGAIALVKSDGHLLLYRVAFTFLSLAFLFNTAIGAGDGTAIYWLFPFPLVFFFFFGKKEGTIVTTVFFIALCLLLFNPFSLNIYKYEMTTSLRFIASLVLVTMIAYGLEVSRDGFGKMFMASHAKLLDEKRNLQKALRQISTLNALIPICCHCKKIRNDEGYWQQLEVYMHEHISADFSHGICPDCAREIYQNVKNPEGAADKVEQTDA